MLLLDRALMGDLRESQQAVLLRYECRMQWYLVRFHPSVHRNAAVRREVLPLAALLQPRSVQQYCPGSECGLLAEYAHEVLLGGKSGLAEGHLHYQESIANPYAFLTRSSWLVQYGQS